MVLCCVPNCGTDSWRCDPSVTFHDFPSSPDLAAKWIKQINSAIKVKPMWFPRGRAVICSKHFLQTDFKDDSDALKPRCVPTVFGFKYIGKNPEPSDWRNSNNVNKKSPLIVKVIKTQENVLENDNHLVISDVPSQAAEYADISDDFEPSMCTESLSETCKKILPSSPEEAIEINVNESACQFSKTYYTSISPLVTPEKENKDMCGNNVSSFNEIPKSVPKMKFCSSLNNNHRKPRKRERCSNELIEIGPNTFLKINPDVIKVNKKLTPSGNTVLQFIMDQKLAKSTSSDLLPKLIQGTSKAYTEQDSSTMSNSLFISSSNGNRDHPSKDDCAEKETVVQHVLGHLVDTHVCKESCSDLKLTDDDVFMEVDEKIEGNDKPCNEPCRKIFSDTHLDANMSCENIESNDNADSTCIAKAPVLLTTNVPLSHCFMEKPKYVLQLKQKSRQIAALKFKLTSLTKKVEELEDRCIVQERQLSYSFIKRLKTIRKNASKGDPCATYILEQIRGYSRKSKMRWSDSTLSQCAVWCRKAPYAYEYFKKAEFFKLPCLGTVKRFIKKHPELKFKKSNNVGPGDDDESSSDFDFDESDSDEGKDDNDKESEQLSDKTVLSASSDQMGVNNLNQTSQISVSNGTMKMNDDNPVESIQVISNNSLSHETLVEHNLPENEETDKIHQMPKGTECNSFPIAVDGSNLEVQELILPSGEVVQCYSSNICNGADVGSQYFIIPNVGEQNSGVDHEYSVVQTESLPVLLQNYDNSQLPVQQQELIFIANSTEQVECSETEITSA